MDDFKGKTAFITGGASGIGLAMAQEFLKAGAKVMIADIRQDALDKAVKTLGGGDKVRAIQLDVTDRSACAKAVETIGKVHILCPNAGVFMGGPTQDASFDDWDFVLGINLGGVVNIVKTFMPRMIAAGEGGHIVLRSSIEKMYASGGAGVSNPPKFVGDGVGGVLAAGCRRGTRPAPRRGSRCWRRRSRCGPGLPWPTR